MRVRVRCFATLREVSAAQTDLDLPELTTVASAWTVMTARYPGLEPHREFTQPARNGAVVSWDALLADGVPRHHDPNHQGRQADRDHQKPPHRRHHRNRRWNCYPGAVSKPV